MASAGWEIGATVSNDFFFKTKIPSRLSREAILSLEPEQKQLVRTFQLIASRGQPESLRWIAPWVL
jgi:hypothetical protein